MAAKSRRPKRNSRRPARKPAKARVRPKARKASKATKATKARKASKASKARPRKTRKAARPKPAPRRRAAKRPVKARKAVTARRPAKRTKPTRQPARKPAASRPRRERLPILAGTHGRPGQRPALDRTRRVLSHEERFDQSVETDAASEDTARMLSAARTGRDEFREKLEQNTAASPRLTAGDIDANWQDAYAVGDEAPGGDNPTPDQDIVDDIGRALGVEYADDEELKGADKLEERDRHRWELDPASSEDWPHGDKDSD